MLVHEMEMVVVVIVRNELDRLGRDITRKKG
jgi:hypothetical protein